MGDDQEFIPHEDEEPNDPNAPHGVNAEIEKLEVIDGLNDEST